MVLRVLLSVFACVLLFAAVLVQVRRCSSTMREGSPHPEYGHISSKDRSRARSTPLCALTQVCIHGHTCHQHVLTTNVVPSPTSHRHGSLFGDESAKAAIANCMAKTNAVLVLVGDEHDSTLKAAWRRMDKCMQVLESLQSKGKLAVQNLGASEIVPESDPGK